MIKDLERIRTESILLDASLIVASIFIEEGKRYISEECTEFLNQCAARGILLHVTPEACLHLWKMLFSVHTKQSEDKEAPNSRQDPLHLSANRVEAFLEGPIDVLILTPETFREATDLWLEKEGKAGIEACVAMCGLRKIRRQPPYFIATANHQYDALESHDVVIMKPSGLSASNRSR